MRKPVIAGNWKMNMNAEEAVNYAREFSVRVSDVTEVEIVLAPPFTSLRALSSELEGTGIRVAAQNMHYEERGAFTGEEPADMLLEAGASHVIIGHSERRQYFGETDETVNRKVRTALAKGLVPIMCVGETLDEREEGEMENVIRVQVQEGLNGVTTDDPANLIIAYEPVWAIGTGKTASPGQAQEVHLLIREILKGMIDGGEKVRILYGGSMKPENVSDLMAEKDIDGGLVGGASLKPDSFEKIVKYYD